MTEVPKIVHDRLRSGERQRATGEREHPEADLLTAFAEQALSVSERDGVLEHLAFCGDCREVIALALPADDSKAVRVAADAEVAQPVGTPRGTLPRVAVPRWFNFEWPALHWAALTAGVAVVGVVLLLRPGKLNQPQTSAANEQIAVNTPLVPNPSDASPPMATTLSGATTSGTTSGASPGATLMNRAVMNRAVPDNARGAQLDSQAQLSKKLVTRSPAAPVQARSGNLNAKRDAEKLYLENKDADGSVAYDSLGAHGASESVEVSAAAPVADIASSGDRKLVARNDAPPVEKAKLPAQEFDAVAVSAEDKTETPAAGAPVKVQSSNSMYAAKMSAARIASPSRPVAPQVSWMITAGVLHRSQDGGQNWLTSLHADHALLCYASHDQDVWTGGQAGMLFHSSDGGVTWVQVKPSIASRTLTSDVTHIDVASDAASLQQVVVSTNDNEIWSSADGGKTWEKK
jgi:Photosynthesis system II assembly factor YCF48